MKKLFISVPMRNRTEHAIKASIEQMHKIAEAVFGEELEVIPTYFEDNPPENTNMALWYLGESIKKLSEADRFIGIYDEDNIQWRFRCTECRKKRTFSRWQGSGRSIQCCFSACWRLFEHYGGIG